MLAAQRANCLLTESATVPLRCARYVRRSGRQCAILRRPRTRYTGRPGNVARAIPAIVTAGCYGVVMPPGGPAVLVEPSANAERENHCASNLVVVLRIGIANSFAEDPNDLLAPQDHPSRRRGTPYSELF